MNGKMKLFLKDNGAYFTIAGGPYRKKPAQYLGVNCAADIDLPASVKLAIPDFGVPSQKNAARAVKEAVTMILAGDALYVGCGYGQGRTGLFMALLAKAFGVEDPVAYVRQHYYAKAVETAEQHDFVDDFSVPFGVWMKITLARFFYFWSHASLTRPV